MTASTTYAAAARRRRLETWGLAAGLSLAWLAPVTAAITVARVL